MEEEEELREGGGRRKRRKRRRCRARDLSRLAATVVSGRPVQVAARRGLPSFFFFYRVFWCTHSASTVCAFRRTCPFRAWACEWARLFVFSLLRCPHRRFSGPRANGLTAWRGVCLVLVSIDNATE